MKITGGVFGLPDELWDNLNTDAILAGQYLRVPEDELGRYAFATVVADFGRRLGDCTILVAGRNVGCGSSREQAPKALLGCGTRMIVAESFGTIFFRNALNLGLGLLRIPDRALLRGLEPGSVVSADLRQGTLTTADGRHAQGSALAGPLLPIMRAGGLLALLRDDPTAFG